MGKRKRPGRYQSKDRFFEQAKREGLLSRAAYKLQEIDAKYRLFKPGHKVIDLGAAPGGWSQVALKAVGATGQVLGVDLELGLKVQGLKFQYLQADLEDEATQTRIGEALDGPSDVVLSDMAPATSGIKFRDQLRSAELARRAWGVAQAVLKDGGNFVVKIFPGEELASLKKDLQTHFQKVHEFIPQATRETSKEIYLVGIKYKKRPVG